MEAAISKEINKKYTEAVGLYEKEINDDKFSASIECYVNLAFLYWSFAFEFFEFDIPNNISEKWSTIGGNRYQKILKSGIEVYPRSLELNFWRKYFSHIIYSEDFSEGDCEQLIEKYKNDENKIPYFYLYLFNKKKYEVKKNELLNECTKQPTAKNLYIMSIIGMK